MHPPETELEIRSTTAREDFELEENPPPNAIEQEPLPPNGGYGWVVTLGVFLINAATWGVNGAWGVYLSYYLDNEIFPGGTRLQYSLIGGLSVAQALLIGPLVSAFNRRFGTRNTLLLGSVLMFVGLMLSSLATAVWQLFVTQAMLSGWGMGLLFLTATTVLPPWFSTRRGLATGLSTSGVGLGGLAYTLLANSTIEKLGLQWSYRINALTALAITLICSFMLKDFSKPAQPRRVIDFSEWRRVESLLILAWGLLTETGYTVLLYTLPDYATSIGLTQSQGAMVGALLNLGLAIGRPAVGYYSDTFGRINIAAAMSAVCGVLCLCLWIPAKSYATLLTFALLAGCVCGTFWSTISAVVAEVAGLPRLPAVFQMIFLPMVLPTTFAEPLVLGLVDSAGYLQAQIFVGCLFVCGACFIWLLRSWKLEEMDREQAEVSTSVVAASGVLSRSRRAAWLNPRRLVQRARI